MKRTKRIVALAAVFILLLGISIQAQAPQGAPVPGPEVKRLAYFIGTWKEEGTAHMGAMGGPEGKMTATNKYEWLSGGFFVVGHADGMNSMGPDKELSVWGWDPAEKIYTYHAFDNSGEATLAKGTLDGDTWTWTADDNSGPAPMKFRVTIKEVTKTQYTFKMETSTDGTAWTLAAESTANKVVAAPAAAPVKK